MLATVQAAGHVAASAIAGMLPGLLDGDVALRSSACGWGFGFGVLSMPAPAGTVGGCGTSEAGRTPAKVVIHRRRPSS